VGTVVATKEPSAIDATFALIQARGAAGQHQRTDRHPASDAG